MWRRADRGTDCLSSRKPDRISSSRVSLWRLLLHRYRSHNKSTQVCICTFTSYSFVLPHFTCAGNSCILLEPTYTKRTKVQTSESLNPTAPEMPWFLWGCRIVMSCTHWSRECDQSPVTRVGGAFWHWSERQFCSRNLLVIPLVASSLLHQHKPQTGTVCLQCKRCNCGTELLLWRPIISLYCLCAIVYSLITARRVSGYTCLQTSWDLICKLRTIAAI